MVHSAHRTAPVPFEQLRADHEAMVAEATAVAGGTRDSRRRGEAYYALFEASGGNFMFPLVAAHGSLWGVRHTLRIEGLLRPFAFLPFVRRWLAAFDAVRDVNRRVFIEIHSTFWFTKRHGHHPRAGEIVKPEVLALYNRIHAAIDRGERLPLEERRAIYYEVFVHEQHDIVDPEILDAAEACGTPLLVRLLRHVRPRFAYFPPGERLRFTDFTSVDQRNREGLRALAFAEQVGPERVREAMGEY